jgi:hypothetical protein
MPRILFLKDFDWKPKKSVTQVYKAGNTYMVTTPCATKAKAKGFGIPVEPMPRRKERAHEETSHGAPDEQVHVLGSGDADGA